jgi:Xaa-Pro aminopeptidase
MFAKEIYIKRRNHLKELVGKGIILFLGNTDVPFNYNANTYSFRQDSSFLYFCGIKLPGLAIGIDIDDNKEILFGNDIDIDDIIWMGELPTMKDYAQKAGIKETLPYHKLDAFLEKALKQGRKIHFLPAYRAETKIEFENLLGISVKNINKEASEQLIKAVIRLRSIKEQVEIEEIEKAVDVAYTMHTTAMKMALPGISEQEIYGNMEGIALTNGGPVSFPVILSVNGQILHNHNHSNILKKGDLLVADAGYETPMHYCIDITRTTPVGGVFSPQQKDIYQAVLDANLVVVKNAKPGILYKVMHLITALINPEI